MTKLTLSVDEAVVEKAKQIAEANQTSVSAMFAQFVESVAGQRAGRRRIGPLTRQLSGLLKLPSGKDYKELLTDALMDKYRVAKVNVFVDTNILLDVLARREPFYADSAEVWTLAETGQVAGFVSTLSLPNLFYLLRRTKGRKTARKALGILRDIFSLVPLDVQITNQAIDADIADFEDAIQFFSALRAGAATLITRNPKDFPSGDIAVQTPAEFLATHFPQ